MVATMITRKLRQTFYLYASKGSLIDGNKLTKVQGAMGSSVMNYRRERELHLSTMGISDLLQKNQRTRAEFGVVSKYQNAHNEGGTYSKACSSDGSSSKQSLRSLAILQEFRQWWFLRNSERDRERERENGFRLKQALG